MRPCKLLRFFLAQHLSPPKSSGTDLRRSINAHKLLRYGLDSAQLTVEQESSRVVHLVREYFEALPLGKDLPKLELQPGDDLAILAAQACVNMFALDNTDAHLHNAIVLLEYASKKSPQSYQIHLVLVRIYRLLGVVDIVHLACPIVSGVFLVRRTAASFRSLSSFECETNTERHLVASDPFSLHQLFISGHGRPNLCF